MPKQKPFHYHVRPVLKPDIPAGRFEFRPTTEHEQFVGQIQGEKASDLEERFARALDKLQIGYDFRVRITSAALGVQHLTHAFANIHGEAEIDFLVQSRGQTTPIMIDGYIGHFYTPSQADHDRQKTVTVDTFGIHQNWRPTVRIPFTELVDQNYADRKVRELFS